MSTFSEQALQEKLERLSSSQDSIETLSLWMIHHRLHASASVEAWLQCFVNSGPDKRLLLIYLANDILQNSRRRGADEFLELFKPPLRRVASLTHGQKFQTSVERVLRIWKDRRVYENRFVKELELLIEPNRQVDDLEDPSAATATPDFKISLVEDALTELRKFEGELKVKSAILSSLRIDISDTSSLLMLKDKSAGGQFLSQFDESTYKLQEVVECVGIEVNERKNILDMLQDCRTYQLQNKENLQNLLKDYVQLKAHLVSLQHQLKDRLVDLEKAQDTATSDPTSQKDIIVSGDMELDSDSDSQEEPMPIPHPTPPPHFVPVNPSPAAYPPPPLYASSLPPRGGAMLPTPPLGRPPFPTHLPPLHIPPNAYPAMPALPPHPLGVRPPHGGGMPPFSPQPRLHMPASYPPMDAQHHITPPVLPSPAVSSNYPVSTAAITALPSSIQSSFASPFPPSRSLSSPLSSLPSSLSSSLPSGQFSSSPSGVPFTQFSPSSIQSSFGFSFSPTTPISSTQVSSLSSNLPSTFSTSLLSTQLSTLSSSLSSGQGQFSPVPSTNAVPSDSNPVGGGGGIEDNTKEFSEQAFPKSLLNDYYSDSSGSDDERETTKPLQTRLGQRNKSGEEVHLSLEASTAITQPAVSLNDSLPPPPSMFSSLLSPAKSEIVPQSSSALSSTVTTTTVTPTTFTSVTIPSTTVTSTTLTSTPSRLPNPRQLQPENIKITPSLTSVLSDIFPQLSKSLENKRKRKLDDGTGANTQQLPSDFANSMEPFKSPKVESVAMDAAASIEMGGASMGDNNQMGSISSNLVPIPKAPLEIMPGAQMVEEKSIEPDQMFNVPPQLMYSQERPPPHPNSFPGGRPPPPGSPGFYPPGPAQGFFPYNNRPPFPPRTRYPPHMYPRQQFRPGFRGGPPPHNFRPRFH